MLSVPFRKKKPFSGCMPKRVFTPVRKKICMTLFLSKVSTRGTVSPPCISREAGENDYRWAAWFQTISNNLRFVKLTDPYQLSTGNNRPAGQIPGVNLIRLPEMYYIAAECLLRKNDPKAADYFNAVLESRGLVALDDRIPAESLTIEKITQERYKEFVGEGQTFFNMKRLNLDIQAITGEILPAANSIYTVPVPEEEFNYRNEVYDVKQ